MNLSNWRNTLITIRDQSQIPLIICEGIKVEQQKRSLQSPLTSFISTEIQGYNALATVSLLRHNFVYSGWEVEMAYSVLFFVFCSSNHKLVDAPRKPKRHANFVAARIICPSQKLVPAIMGALHQTYTTLSWSLMVNDDTVRSSLDTKIWCVKHSGSFFLLLRYCTMTKNMVSIFRIEVCMASLH